MPKFIDLTGQKFGRLIVVKRMDNDKWGKIYWLCECHCRSKKVIRGNHLRSGKTKSCGCLLKEGSHTTHGHYKNGKKSNTYHSWTNMIQRCTNPNNKAYHYYGDRGITVCKRWRNSFENFLGDMGEVSEGYQIDRVDNNGNYCKSNCRWVTSKINNRNRRDNYLETYNGKTQCLVEWSEEFGINYHTLRWRLDHGWSIGKAFTTPVRKYNKKKGG